MAAGYGNRAADVVFLAVAEQPYLATMKLTQDERRKFAMWVGILRREWDVDSTEAAVMEAVRRCAMKP